MCCMGGPCGRPCANYEGGGHGGGRPYNCLLLCPGQIEIVSLPLYLFDLRRSIADETSIAKKPVFKKAVGFSWVKLNITRIEKTVSEHDISCSAITPFVVPRELRQVLVRVRNDLRNRKTLHRNF